MYRLVVIVPVQLPVMLRRHNPTRRKEVMKRPPLRCSRHSDMIRIRIIAEHTLRDHSLLPNIPRRQKVTVLNDPRGLRSHVRPHSFVHGEGHTGWKWGLPMSGGIVGLNSDDAGTRVESRGDEVPGVAGESVELEV